MLKTKDITMAIKGDTLEVHLPCEIDHHSAVTLRRRIDEEICRTRPKLLRLDAAGVDFMDSSGLGLMMGRYALMNKLGGQVVLCHPGAGVMRMLRLAGMERILRIEP